MEAENNEVYIYIYLYIYCNLFWSWPIALGLGCQFHQKHSLNCLFKHIYTYTRTIFDCSIKSFLLTRSRRATKKIDGTIPKYECDYKYISLEDCMVYGMLYGKLKSNTFPYGGTDNWVLRRYLEARNINPHRFKFCMCICVTNIRQCGKSRCDILLIWSPPSKVTNP